MKASRITAVFFTAVEVLLLVRFALKLFGANQGQPLASAVYAITEPLVAPWRPYHPPPSSARLNRNVAQ